MCLAGGAGAVRGSDDARLLRRFGDAPCGPGATMKAALVAHFGRDPEHCFEFRDNVEVPQPGEGQVLVQVRVVGGGAV